MPTDDGVTVSNIARVSAHYDAGARGDLPGMMASFDPKITWVEAAGFPLAGLYTGPEAIAEGVFALIAKEWSEFGMHVDEFVESGDSVIALGHYRGAHRATGRILDARTAHIWRFSNDKIVGFEQITDTLLVALAAATDKETV